MSSKRKYQDREKGRTGNRQEKIVVLMSDAHHKQGGVVGVVLS